MGEKDAQAFQEETQFPMLDILDLHQWVQEHGLKPLEALETTAKV
jgi:hypothetical protein